MDKKYQIFVSSTYEDLKEERMKVLTTILKMNHIPIGMEAFNASSQMPWEYIQKRMDDCDYYILIIAGRYGSLTNDYISFTEKEYKYAFSRKIPVIPFIYEDYKTSSDYVALDTNIQNKLNNFVETIEKNHKPDYWNTADGLGNAVNTSLSEEIAKCSASGWVRANTSDKPIDFEDFYEFWINKISVLNEERKSEILSYKISWREMFIFIKAKIESGNTSKAIKAILEDCIKDKIRNTDSNVKEVTIRFTTIDNIINILIVEFDYLKTQRVEGTYALSRKGKEFLDSLVSI